MQQNIDTAEVTRRARKMTLEALRYSAKDASEAAVAAEDLLSRRSDGVPNRAAPARGV